MPKHPPGTHRKKTTTIADRRKRVKESSPKKQGSGRVATQSKEEAGRKQRIRSSLHQRKIDNAARDIAGDDWQALINNINWERRIATRYNLQRFNEVYLPNIFYLNWSQDQLRCIRKTETVFLDEAMFALAMPRGGGKTAICRGGITWGTLNAHKRFPFNIASTDPKSLQTLTAIKSFLYGSPLLLQDYPEICWPIKKTENRFHLARGQLFYNQNTCIDWGANSVRFPCLILPDKDAELFLNPRINGKKVSLKEEDVPLSFLESHEGWIPVAAGINIATAGIGGAIRGEAETHPLTLEQPRPDVAILDDIQKDQLADSPAQIDKLVLLIEGAVNGLAGPGRHISVLMPCTVTREGDTSDRFLDTMKKPEYRGERCPLVSHWPTGITDNQISMESQAGKLWNQYGELWKESFRKFEYHSRDCEHCRENLINPCKKGSGIQRKATNLYKKHRKKMDDGFVVTWEDRYGSPKLQRDGTVIRDTKEISAQQHAMNLRFKAPDTFPPEYQNQGRKIKEEGEVMITAGQLATKTIALDRGLLPVDAQHLAAFIDVQNEGFFYAVLAVAPDFSGSVVDYGTLPIINTRYFTKGQMEGWSYLTRDFFNQYPQGKAKAIKTESGRLRAPLEAKIYHGLSQAVPYLLNKEYIRQDQHQTIMRVERLGIDTRWGQASDCIKRYIRESGFQNVVPYYGQSYPPTNKQLEEYQRGGEYKTWYFEDQKHPQLKEPKWVVRPNPDGMFYMSADVNRLKDFIFARLASPPGSPGSISLFNGSPERHEMFCDHVCNSEYPIPVTARGMTKNQWQTRQGRPDNDWLDCMVGCCAIASMLGACIVTGGEKKPTPPSKVSSRWKKGRR